jgi:hypothetical protein
MPCTLSPIHLDRGALEDTKVDWRALSFVYAARTQNTDRGVDRREFLVLLQHLTERAQPVTNQIFQAAAKTFSSGTNETLFGEMITGDTVPSGNDLKCFSKSVLAL